MRIAVLASGTGSNFSAIMNAQKKGILTVGEVVCVFSDQPNAFVLEKAEKEKIPHHSVRVKDFENKAAYEQHVVEYLHKNQVDFLVLAGYLRILGPTLLQAYGGKTINIHPSLLPAFPGLHSIERALEAKVKTTGVTIHWVDEGLDTGPIIIQEEVVVTAEDTIDTLSQKIHQVEHEIYPMTIQKVLIENSN